MRKKENDLDEMQKFTKNKIGHQTFILMIYLLLIDLFLNGIGIHWLEYPENIMVVIILCSFIYLMRIIKNDAYLSPKAKKSKSGIKIALLIFFSIALAVATVLLSKNSLSIEIIGNNGIDSAFILFIVPFLGLIIVSIVSIIKNINNNKDK
ncbi:MAG: hypothetical protein A2Y15_03815 [Clostridiales bacterium GWF2_36_10]|nr:MAG: hypothetical protein A2Y15_03815 [Clostridiales bacterium GWF2_36_10]HAN22090.1 hypothetical protein [Clostridiales bacterium]